MSGAVKLAVTGVQDQWLTGDPEFSYFLTAFKRHTKFSIEQIETPFDGNIDFGEELQCILPQNKGDLIKGMTVKFILTQPEDVDGNPLNYVPCVCSHLIETADLYIGGQLIERLTGEYIYMHQQLHNTIDDVEQTLYFLNGHGNEVLDFTGEYTFFIDLPFYFNRNPSLAIPTIALSKQLVEVRIKLRSLDEMINGGVPELGVVANMKNASLDTEFAFVTPEEQSYLRSMPLEYVITQLQVSQAIFTEGQTEKSFMVNFKNPVREFYILATNENATTPNEYEKITKLKLDFNDTNIIDADYNFLNYQQALVKHVNSPTAISNFATYSFAEDPEVYYPTGQVNMSRIFHKLMTIGIETDKPGPTTVKIYAVSYNVLHIESGLAGLKF
jgi:hypothetical protein